MIPQAVVALASFLFLVAPGLTYELLREHSRPPRAETAFREASRVALGSLYFTLLAAGILALGRFLTPSLLPDPGEWLQSGAAYITNHYQLIVSAAVAQVLLACSLATAAAWWRNRATPGVIRPVSGWFRVLREWRQANEQVVAMVTLQDGDRYFGVVKSYSPELQLEDRELILQGPLAYQSPDDEEPIGFGKQWAYIVLPASSIQYLVVGYRLIHSTTNSSPPHRQPSSPSRR